jgi:ribonuclease P protein component
MINAKHRFHGHNSLSYVYRNGQIVRGPLTSIKYVSNLHRSDYRLAIVVSKKVSKSAVVRNRIRRRLYEAVRRLEGHITRPYDMVITVFSDTAATITPEEIDRLVYTQLKQAGITQKG